jgi:hypothetical protein
VIYLGNADFGPEGFRRFLTMSAPTSARPILFLGSCEDSVRRKLSQFRAVNRWTIRCLYPFCQRSQGAPG